MHEAAFEKQQNARTAQTDKNVLWRGPECLLVNAQWLASCDHEIPTLDSYIKYLKPLAQDIETNATLAALMRKQFLALGEKIPPTIDVEGFMKRIVSRVKEGHFFFVKSDAVQAYYRIQNLHEAGYTQKGVNDSNVALPALAVPESHRSAHGMGKLFNGLVSPAYNRLCVAGNTVSMITGEVIRAQTDFDLPAPISFPWIRTYRSSNGKDRGLGAGWMASWLSHIQINDQGIVYCDVEGREIVFPTLDHGQSCENPVEQITLSRIDAHRYRITREEGKVAYLFGSANRRKRLSEITDRFNNAVRFYYSADNKLVYLQDSAGRRLKLDYNITNHLRSVSLCNDSGEVQGNPLVQYNYSNDGNLIKVIDADGNSQHFQYKKHLLVKHTNKCGFAYHYEWDRYDSNGKCLRNYAQSDAEERSESGGHVVLDYQFRYSPDENLSRAMDGRGNTTIYEYNESGLLVEKTEPEGGLWQFDYNAIGQLTSESNPLGGVTTYQYNSDGRLNRLRDPHGNTTYFKYDKAGHLVHWIDALGQRWQRAHDTNGRMLSQTDPDGNSTHYLYNERGLPQSITNPLGHTQHFDWSEQGLLLGYRDAQGTARQYQYDDLGRLTQETDDAGNATLYFYNRSGNLTQVFFPDDSSVQMQYNPQGSLTRYVDPLGKTTHFRYQGFDRPVERINPDSSRVRYKYDAQLNLSAIINENGDECRMTYDRNDRLGQITGFDGRCVHISYNAAGFITCVSDGKSRVTQFQRDTTGRLLKQWSSDGDGSRFEYDPLGRLTRAVNAHCELLYRYDAHGRIREEIQNGLRVRHAYDKNGDEIGLMLPNGNVIQYNRDNVGRLSKLLFNKSPVLELSRDTLGRVIRAHTQGAQREHEYDTAGRMAYLHVYNTRETLLQQRTRFDKSGKLQRMLDSKQGKLKYHYDLIGRIAAVEASSAQRFRFDAAGNRLDAGATGSTSVRGNRLNTYIDHCFSYDDAGNLTQEQYKDQTARFIYNTQNQLIAVKTDDEIIEYFYDPLGRCIKKKTASGETVFLWNRNQLLSEHSKSATVYFIAEPIEDVPLIQVRDGEAFVYHTDHQGAPVCITNADGDVVWEARYDPLGRARVFTDNLANPLRMRGQYYDCDSGLHYVTHRFYHPGLGRLLQQNWSGLLTGRELNAYLLSKTGNNSLSQASMVGRTQKYPYNPLVQIPTFPTEAPPIALQDTALIESALSNSHLHLIAPQR
jgi:RHS repeat-associated protein